jgi:hypothetical protein
MSLQNNLINFRKNTPILLGSDAASQCKGLTVRATKKVGSRGALKAGLAEISLHFNVATRSYILLAQMPCRRGVVAEHLSARFVRRRSAN